MFKVEDEGKSHGAAAIRVLLQVAEIGRGNFKDFFSEFFPLLITS